MANLLEQLAELEVPPAPPSAQFDRQLHERVNRSLFVWQLVDLVVSGMPWAMLHFARALVGLITFTVTGQYEAKPKKPRR
jgi:hypothetical protein